MGHGKWFWVAGDRPLLAKHQRLRKRAQLRGLSGPAHRRLEWLIFYQTVGGRDATKTARYFGIRRETVHKWLRRFDERDLGSLEDRDRRPHRLRQKRYTHQQVRRVTALRKPYPTEGRAKLLIHYRESHRSDPLTDHDLKNIIHDHHLFASRATRPRRRHPAAPKRRLPELTKHPSYTPAPGFLVELDGIEERIAGKRVYILTAICYHSRLAFAYAYRSKASGNAADFLRRVSLLFGGRLRHVHVDNGSEFKGLFLQAIRTLRLTLYHARPYRGQDKPLVERFNDNLEQECLYLGGLTTDLAELNRTVFEYLLYYNFERPHHGIGLKRPIQVATLPLHTTNPEVLPMCAPKTQP